MSTIAVPDRSPATSSRSASALNLIGGAWVEGRGNTSRDIYKGFLETMASQVTVSRSPPSRCPVHTFSLSQGSPTALVRSRQLGKCRLFLWLTDAQPAAEQADKRSRAHLE
jgi:hypothetical protein